MNAERLNQLIQAYGADPRRWPDAERPAGERLLAEQPGLRARLEDARRLDDLLAVAPRAAVSPALHDRVLASAVEAGLGARRVGGGLFDMGRRLSWLAGAGWAAAACAGALSGVALTGQMTAADQADAVLYQASFSLIDDTEVLG